jgi:uncharacterized protein YlxP (DUF503 family)
MDCGYVGTLTVDLHLPLASSLKDKRKELHRLKALLVKRTSCAIAEVDNHDLHRRSRLTLAVVTREHAECQRLLDAASRLLHTDPSFEALSESRDVIAVDASPMFDIGSGAGH